MLAALVNVPANLSYALLSAIVCTHAGAKNQASRTSARPASAAARGTQRRADERAGGRSRGILDHR